MTKFEPMHVFAEQAPPTSVAAKTNGNHLREAEAEALLSGLSPSQAEAVSAADHSILLLAPAGTGKTRTLTGRAVRAIRDGTDPLRVLVCTYTNAAARELKDRLGPLLTTDVERLWIGTLHSIGLRIIREHPSELGLVGAGSIVDEAQAMEILGRILREVGHSSVDTPDERQIAQRSLRFIEEAKNRQISPKDAAELLSDHELHWAAGISDQEIEIYARYENWMRTYDMIDYADMLYLPIRLLEKNKALRQLWRTKFDHILVDEYQDLSLSQIRLIRNLIDTSRCSFFAAADDDQCIYGWRGSDLENTVDFKSFWPGTRIMQLADNYRTPRAIFQSAAELIHHVQNRYPKTVNTWADPDALIRIITASDPTNEKQRIHDSIVDGMESFKVPFEKVAVLCRTNKLCQEMATYLSSRGLTVNLHENLPLNVQPVATLIAWMQLSTKADHPLMFDRLVNYPTPFMTESMHRDLEQRVQRRNQDPEKHIGPVGYLLGMHDAGKLPKGSSVAQLADLILAVRATLANPDLDAPFARIGEMLGIKAAAMSSDNVEYHAFGRFVHLADEMVAQIGLDSTLASLTSLDMNMGKPGINITTMHGAKGLEFDLVIAPGWEDGEFPSGQSRGDNVDDERRLAYVTMTRAKKMLVISWSSNRRSGGRPSRFIAEMGKGD